MLLAELEVFHSRPIAPTRRVSLGVAVLPTAPPPGFGGLLLGAIASHFAPGMDPDLLDDLDRLAHQVEHGQRIAQPRLRHRLQDDRIGLNRCRHLLEGTGEELRFAIDDRGSPEPNVLAAVYAVGRLASGERPAVMRAVRRGLAWRGELGADFVEHLSESRGTASWSMLGGRDPIVWALGVLGLPPEATERRAVQERFRLLLREAHPDHGGATGDAAQRIGELTEARRILLAR
ncbi:MAG TPA: hypothetical protein P5254_14120 [Aquihabitans sp.]|nr:hypothetical protein [Aquihabitans sp.]